MYDYTVEERKEAERSEEIAKHIFLVLKSTDSITCIIGALAGVCGSVLLQVDSVQQEAYLKGHTEIVYGILDGSLLKD